MDQKFPGVGQKSIMVLTYFCLIISKQLTDVTMIGRRL